MTDLQQRDGDPVDARVSRTFSPMLSLQGYLGCQLTRCTPLPDGLDATFTIGPLPSEPPMLEARISVRQKVAVVVRLFRDGVVVASLSANVPLANLAGDVDPMVELMATVMDTLIHQLPEDERSLALAHVRAAHADGLMRAARAPWPTLQ